MEEKITLKKNRKPMPYFIKLGLFLFILGLVVSILLSVAYVATKDAIAANKEAEALEEKNLIIEKINGLGFTDVLECTESYNDILIKDSNSVENIFSCKNGENNAYAFKLLSKNKFTTISVLVILEEDVDEAKVKYIEVLNDATTLGSSKNTKFYNNLFGSVDSTYSTYDASFEIVTGATYSSNSVKSSIGTCFEQLEAMKKVGAN